MINSQVVKKALDYLHVSNRIYQLADEILFFCASPEGMTFDISLHADGTVRIWRFICENMPHSQIGKCLTYSCPNIPGATVGFEVTRDTDLCFFSEQHICKNDKDAFQKFVKHLTGFTSLSKGLNLKCFFQIAV